MSAISNRSSSKKSAAIQSSPRVSVWDSATASVQGFRNLHANSVRSIRHIHIPKESLARDDMRMCCKRSLCFVQPSMTLGKGFREPRNRYPRELLILLIPDMGFCRGFKETRHVSIQERHEPTYRYVLKPTLHPNHGIDFSSSRNGREGKRLSLTRLLPFFFFSSCSKLPGSSAHYPCPMDPEPCAWSYTTSPRIISARWESKRYGWQEKASPHSGGASTPQLPLVFAESQFSMHCCHLNIDIQFLVSNPRPL